MVAEAIHADRFFLPTDDQVRQMLQRRAADPDEFIRAQLATFKN
jgi:hypothetical protein